MLNSFSLLCVQCRKCKLVKILANGEFAMRDAQIPLSDRAFFVWLRCHVYWFQLIQYTLQLYDKLEDSSPAIKDLHERASQDSGVGIVEALKDFKKAHFDKAFHQWKGRMRATLDPEDQPHLPCTARRLLYRYLKA